MKEIHTQGSKERVWNAPAEAALCTGEFKLIKTQREL